MLSAVALRAEPAIEQAHRAAALEALTERTRLAADLAPAQVGAVPAEGEHDDDEEPRAWDPSPDSGLGRLIVPAAVGLTAFLAVAYATTAWLNRPAPPSPRAEAIEDELSISGAGGRRAAPTASRGARRAAPPQTSAVPPRAAGAPGSGAGGAPPPRSVQRASAGSAATPPGRAAADGGRGGRRAGWARRAVDGRADRSRRPAWRRPGASTRPAIPR